MSDLMFPNSLGFVFLMLNVICKLLIKRYRNLSGHVEMIEFKIMIRVFIHVRTEVSNFFRKPGFCTLEHKPVLEFSYFVG